MPQKQWGNPFKLQSLVQKAGRRAKESAFEHQLILCYLFLCLKQGLIVAQASFTLGEQILESFSCLHLLTAGITPACITAPEEQTWLSVRNEHATSRDLAGSGDRRFRPFRKPFKHLLVPMAIPLARLLMALPTTPLGESLSPLPAKPGAGSQWLSSFEKRPVNHLEIFTLKVTRVPGDGTSSSGVPLYRYPALVNVPSGRKLC